MTQNESGILLCGLLPLTRVETSENSINTIYKEVSSFAIEYANLDGYSIESNRRNWNLKQKLSSYKLLS